MIDKIWKSIQEASGTIMQQADQFGKGAKEKAYELIGQWIAIFPLLESEGLSINSFAMGYSISPTLEVEFVGAHKDFTPDRLEALIQQYRNNALMLSVLKTIQTTYGLHKRTQSTIIDPLIVKVKIGISPQVKVYIGKPLIE